MLDVLAFKLKSQLVFIEIWPKQSAINILNSQKLFYPANCTFAC